MIDNNIYLNLHQDMVKAMESNTLSKNMKLLETPFILLTYKFLQTIKIFVG